MSATITVVISEWSEDTDDVIRNIDSHIDLVTGWYSGVSGEFSGELDDGLTWKVYCENKQIRDVLYYLGQFAEVSWTYG